MLCYAWSFSCVRLFATPWTVACQAPQSMGILQARILEWVDMTSSRGSSQLRDQTQVSALQVDSLPSEPAEKPKNIGVCSLLLLQGLFLTQELNWGLPNCRQILYRLSQQGSPRILPIAQATVGSLSLLQGIFPTQESHWGLLDYRQIL